MLIESPSVGIQAGRVIRRGQRIATAASRGALEHGAVTFLWTPGEPFADSGPFGFSLDGQVWGKGAARPSYSLSYYYLAFANSHARFWRTA